MSAMTFGYHEADGIKDTDIVDKTITSLIGLMCLHKQDYYLPTSSMLAVKLHVDAIKAFGTKDLATRVYPIPNVL